ncbi:MAG: lysophospholipase [Spirochaetaceae bacterium]|jgi:alpha-beta hydrolase superfamily lysophospholipase|nr:lysophospholipase [Spirochaetaceae bacterium]
MTTSWLTVADGTKLFVRRWKPAGEAVAALQIVHGMGEHSLRYERFASRLCEAGIEVWAADMRGHGLTANSKVNSPAKGGLPGHCADRRAPARLIADIHRVGLSLREKHPNIPLFLMGHSWGSFLVQSYIENYREPRLAGCILSGTKGPDGGALVALGGPFLSVLMLFRKPRSKSRLAAGLADGAYKKAFSPARTPYDWLSRDEAEVEAYREDPLCGQMPSIAFYRDLAFTLSKIHLKKNMARIPRDLPIYVFSGSRDPVGNSGESPKSLVERYTKLGINDIEFVLYPDARHEMLHETNYEEAQENLFAWIQKHVRAVREWKMEN